MSARIILRGMLRLIRVCTLRVFHNVGFLTERLLLCAAERTVYKDHQKANLYMQGNLFR